MFKFKAVSYNLSYTSFELIEDDSANLLISILSLSSNFLYLFIINCLLPWNSFTVAFILTISLLVKKSKSSSLQSHNLQAISPCLFESIMFKKY